MTKDSGINRLTILWLFIGIPIIVALVLKKSFNLGLYGDDWQHLYNLWRDFYVYKTKSFFDIRSYLNPYWPSYLYLGIINHFWGFYPPAYFIASYLMRVFANITLYFLAYELTKSKLAAFLTTIIFLFSAAGLQTTDWVFNMNTYAGLGFLSLATVIYLKIRGLTTFKSYLYPLFIILFALALAIVPTRMHGAVPFLILTDLFLTFIARRDKLKIDRYIIARIMIIILVFTILLHFKSFGEGSFATGRFLESSQIIQAFTDRGYYTIWFYFLGILGHLALPDNISLGNFTNVIVITSLSSIIFGLVISILILKTKKNITYPLIITFNIIWALVLSWIASINPNPMSNLNPYQPYDVLLSIAIGGQFIFWAIWVYISIRKIHHNFSSTLIVSLIWIITLTIIYWLFTPSYIIETTGRYMTMGAAGFAIFFGSLISLLLSKTLLFRVKSEKDRLLSSLYLFVPIVILFFWLLVNLQYSQTYLEILEQTRNRQLTDRAWHSLVKTVPRLDPDGPSVFYFSTDNPLSLQGVLVFGFFMRAGMTWQIPNQDLTPLPSTDYKELLSYVTDGSPLQKVHGRKATPVPLSRIFAFDFRNGILVDITKDIRKKITEDLNQTTQ